MEGIGVEKQDVDEVDVRIDQSIVFSDDKYSVSLPKKDDSALKGDNFQNTKNRFLSFERRFKKTG